MDCSDGQLHGTGVNMRKKKLNIKDMIFDIVVYTVLILITIVTFYPMWYVVVASFSTGSYIAKQGGLLFWPGDFTLQAYAMTFQHSQLFTGFRNSVMVLVMALPINLILTTLCGYFMAENTKVLWKKPIIAMIMFTMFFSGGMIPAYLNIKSLGLYNSLWALVLPGALSVYNANICKTAIEGIPHSLAESAYIDGAGDMSVLFRIILPLMKPTMAVLALYYGVGHWNAWFNASIYIKDKELQPAQNILRNILSSQTSMTEGADTYNAYAEAMKYGSIVIITVPILCVYPFLQKYFTKGAMIGAVKG